jgi:DNA-binding NarL/FixJ family response regulator
VIRVVLVDDHATFRANLRALLAGLEDVEVVAEAEDGRQAVAAAHALAPDVVLMDLTMPGVSGIEATRELTAAAPHVAVVALTMLDDDRAIQAVLRAGAQGYVLKGARRDELARAIRAAAAGEAILGAGVARRLAALVDPAAPASSFPDLTERERGILELVARGLRNDAIAVRLSLSPKTVANNITSILRKLDVTTRAEAAARARDAGLGAPSV